MMSHYERRLERDLTEIRQSVVAIGQQVQTAFKNAVHAVMIHDKEQASHIILADLPINRSVRALDARCHAFVARHLPSAGPLRFVSSVLRMNVALERIGDYAVTIAREQVQLSAPPTEQVTRDIDLLADQAREMLAQAIRAFEEESDDLARGTKAIAKNLDRTFDRIFDDLVESGNKKERPLEDLFATLVILNRVSRVGDQAKNLCEETIFATVGETKAPKQYRVLFLSDRDDSWSRIATAYATRAFSESGVFSSAGFEPAESVAPETLDLLKAKGYVVDESTPRQIDGLLHDLADYHVIVGLAEQSRAKLKHIPFHTTLVQWQPPAEAKQDLEAAHRWLTAEVGELMELLRGEEVREGNASS
jgi:phosphate transport system protein